MRHFSEDDIIRAKEADLVEVARALGYTPVKVGNCYSLKEMDSMRIFNHSNWCRFSRGKGDERGGTQIDFLKVFAGLEVKDAVEWLLSFQGYSLAEEKITTVKSTSVHSKKPDTAEATEKTLVLPEKAESFKNMFGYLCKARNINYEIVKWFVDKGLIYEEKEHHNVVFVGKNKSGEIKFASVRGTKDFNGHGFRCDCYGSDKKYGFNISAEGDPEVHVFEAAIDLMSFCNIIGTTDINAVALGMLSDGPLENYLNEHKDINSVTFHLDNDRPGRDATETLLEKYNGLGFDVYDEPCPEEFKDFNEWLKSGEAIASNERKII